MVSVVYRSSHGHSEMITKEQASEIAAHYLRANGYSLNKQEPECYFHKGSNVIAGSQSETSLALRKELLKLWGSTVWELARDHWVFRFTEGEERDRVWQILEVVVDAETGQPSGADLNPPPRNSRH